jgi:peptide deformylase
MGSAARIAQHEIDHLDGKLITDYAMGVTPTPQDHP